MTDIAIVTEDEEAEAKALIDEQFVEMTGHPMDMRPTGYYVAGRIWTPAATLKTSTGQQIHLPDEYRDERKYTSAVMLVCALGPDAYKGERFRDSGPWCRVGDWVIIPRYEGAAMSYRKVPMVLVPDDRIIGVVDDPSQISSINSASAF